MLLCEGICGVEWQMKKNKQYLGAKRRYGNYFKRKKEKKLLSFYPYPATPKICTLNLDVTKETEILSMTSSNSHKFDLPRADFEEILPHLFLAYVRCRNCTQCSQIKSSNPRP